MWIDQLPRLNESQCIKSSWAKAIAVEQQLPSQQILTQPHWQRSVSQFYYNADEPNVAAQTLAEFTGVVDRQVAAGRFHLGAHAYCPAIYSCCDYDWLVGNYLFNSLLNYGTNDLKVSFDNKNRVKNNLYYLSTSFANSTMLKNCR